MNCIKLSNYKQRYVYRANKLLFASVIVLREDFITFPLASFITEWLCGFLRVNFKECEAVLWPNFGLGPTTSPGGNGGEPWPKFHPGAARRKRGIVTQTTAKFAGLFVSDETSKFVYFYQSLREWLWMEKDMVLTLARDTGWQNILFLKLINKWNSKP